MLATVALYAPGCVQRNLRRLRFVAVTGSSVVYSGYSCVVSNYNIDTGTSNSHAGGVQSVDRAISVLEILARRGETGVSEVAAEIDVHKSTAFRLLGALEARGLVEQAGERGKYRLGFGIVRLAGAVTGRIDITQQGRPVCEDLAEELGETVNIAVRQEHYAVNLYQVRGPGAVTAQNWVGQLTPLHATSSGKILLAYLPTKDRAAILATSGLKKVTEHTITAKTKLEKNLAEIRETGYAWALEELELGLHAMAAPIRNRDGEVVAALSASGPAVPAEQGAPARARSRADQGGGGDQSPHGVPGLSGPYDIEVGRTGGRRRYCDCADPRRSCTQSWKRPMWCSLGTSTPPWRTAGSSSRAGCARRRRSPAG